MANRKKSGKISGRPQLPRGQFGSPTVRAKVDSWIALKALLERTANALRLKRLWRGYRPLVREERFAQEGTTSRRRKRGPRPPRVTVKQGVGLGKGVQGTYAARSSRTKCFNGGTLVWGREKRHTGTVPWGKGQMLKGKRGDQTIKEMLKLLWEARYENPLMGTDWRYRLTSAVNGGG